MRFTIIAVILLVTSPFIYAAQPDRWNQVSDFTATGIHAAGSNAVAWDANRYATSVDGGRSWTTPVAGSSDGNLGIAQAVATPSGHLVLLSDGSIRGMPKRYAGLAVDGAGVAYGQAMDGHIYRLAGVATDTGVIGSLYRPAANGVLVKRDRTGMVLVGSEGAPQPIQVQAQDLPPLMRFAPITGIGTDHWITTDGHLWRIKDGRLGEESQRAARFLCTWGDRDGYHELMEIKGQYQILEEGRGGKRPHQRSRGLPVGLKAVSGTDSTFIALAQDGIWVVDRNL